jgi:diaminopimelate decarboxylase
MDLFRYEQGRLCCEGVGLEDVAGRFGTPAYVYSRATLEVHFDRLLAAFADVRPLVCYSIKSCPNVNICRVLAERGSGMDVVSGGELARALAAGCPADRIVFAGVGKTDEEIAAGLDARIGYFNIESEPEFGVIAAMARERRVVAHAALRVNPDVDPHTHEYTATGKRETKFGVDIDRARAFFERYGRDGWLRLDALHLGSPVYETGPYVEATRKTLGLIDDLEGRGFRIAALDLGGGFGANYETDRSPPAAEYAAAIVPLVRERAARGLRVILEPGRTISGNAGVLLTRVLYVKRGGTKTFVICDAGMHTLIRPALYGSFHFIWPVAPGEGFVPARRGPDVEMAGLVACDVVGPICETGDFLARDRRLPPVERGDLLAVFTAGAYGMSMASTYNSHALPAEVLVSGAEARLIRRRGRVEELLAPEA